MKRLILISVAVILTLSAGAQSTIDKLFNKYQGRDGFTTITVNGNMLKFLANLDNEGDDDLMQYADKFTSVRILVQDEDAIDVENFYDTVIDDVNRGGYEEMVVINSSGDDIKILVKADGKVFKEFLMIAGGSDNAIIQIKGNMTYKEVKSMSMSVKVDGGQGISGLDIF